MPPLDIQPPAPRRNLRLFIAVAIGVLVVCAVLVAGFFFYKNNPFWRAKTIQGTFILNVPGQWKAPSGETVSGVIRYTPSTGALSQIEDGKTVALFPGGFTMSDDMHELFGIRVEGATTTLVRIARNDPFSQITVASGLPLGPYVARSADGTTFAFLAFHSQTALADATAAAQKAHVSETDKPEYIMEQASSLMLSNFDGQSSISIGHATPLSFSPDGEDLLIATTKQYQIITTAGTFLRAVEGLPEVKSPPLVMFSKDREYLVIRELGGPAMLYHLDWAGGRATKLKEFALADGEGFGFGAPGSFLLSTPTSISSYALSTDQLGAPTQYAVASFPQAAIIIGYEK